MRKIIRYKNKSLGVSLKNKVVLITGGGTGIGRAIALTFAQRQALVVINYSKSEKEANDTVERVREANGKAIKIRADISQKKDVKNMFEMLRTKYGFLDILVNNAAWSCFIDSRNVGAITESIYDHVMDVNIKGTFLCCQEAVPLMKKRRNALIINISSTSGFSARGSNIIYCASKAAVISLTKSLSLALAPEIRVNAVAPGFTNTRFISWASEQFIEDIKKSTPMKRIAEPDDIAKVAVALYEDMEFVTGQVIVVDGGSSTLAK